jgi:antitoxin component of MazEF toxin-antitoxin module
MSTIKTTLTTSGNSTAVRLPKELLRMSGLGPNVTLDVKKDKIIIGKDKNPREGWKRQIQKEIAANGLPTMVDDYGDMSAENESTLADGLE